MENKLKRNVCVDQFEMMFQIANTNTNTNTNKNKKAKTAKKQSTNQIIMMAFNKIMGELTDLKERSLGNEQVYALMEKMNEQINELKVQVKELKSELSKGNPKKSNDMMYTKKGIKKLADKHGISHDMITHPTGKNGKINKNDIMNFVQEENKFMYRVFKQKCNDKKRRYHQRCDCPLKGDDIGNITWCNMDAKFIDPRTNHYYCNNHCEALSFPQFNFDDSGKAFLKRIKKERNRRIKLHADRIIPIYHVLYNETTDEIDRYDIIDLDLETPFISALYGYSETEISNYRDSFEQNKKDKRYIEKVLGVFVKVVQVFLLDNPNYGKKVLIHQRMVKEPDYQLIVDFMMFSKEEYTTRFGDRYFIGMSRELMMDLFKGTMMVFDMMQTVKIKPFQNNLFIQRVRFYGGNDIGTTFNEKIRTSMDMESIFQSSVIPIRDQRREACIRSLTETVMKEQINDDDKASWCSDYSMESHYFRLKDFDLDDFKSCIVEKYKHREYCVLQEEEQEFIEKFDQDHHFYFETKGDVCDRDFNDMLQVVSEGEEQEDVYLGGVDDDDDDDSTCEHEEVTNEQKEDKENEKKTETEEEKLIHLLCRRWEKYYPKGEFSTKNIIKRFCCIDPDARDYCLQNLGLFNFDECDRVRIEEGYTGYYNRYRGKIYLDPQVPDFIWDINWTQENCWESILDRLKDTFLSTDKIHDKDHSNEWFRHNEKYLHDFGSDSFDEDDDEEDIFWWNVENNPEDQLALCRRDFVEGYTIMTSRKIFVDIFRTQSNPNIDLETIVSKLQKLYNSKESATKALDSLNDWAIFDNDIYEYIVNCKCDTEMLTQLHDDYQKRRIVGSIEGLQEHTFMNILESYKKRITLTEIPKFDQKWTKESMELMYNKYCELYNGFFTFIETSKYKSETDGYLVYTELQKLELPQHERTFDDSCAIHRKELGEDISLRILMDMSKFSSIIHEIVWSGHNRIKN
jgi:hypothetical protein